MSTPRTLPVGWTVTHALIARVDGRNRWGTDVALGSGRVLKFTGRLTNEQAVVEAAKILRTETALASGRFKQSEPALQNIPIKKPCGCSGDLAPGVHHESCMGKLKSCGCPESLGTYKHLMSCSVVRR